MAHIGHHQARIWPDVGFQVKVLKLFFKLFPLRSEAARRDEFCGSEDREGGGVRRKSKENFNGKSIRNFGQEPNFRSRKTCLCAEPFLLITTKTNGSIYEAHSVFGGHPTGNQSEGVEVELV